MDSKSLTQAILEKCVFSPFNYPGVKLGEQIFGPHENARLLPIIKALIKDREELVKALEEIENEPDNRDYQLNHMAQEALAASEARLKELGK